MALPIFLKIAEKQLTVNKHLWEGVEHPSQNCDQNNKDEDTSLNN